MILYPCSHPVRVNQTVAEILLVPMQSVGAFYQWMQPQETRQLLGAAGVFLLACYALWRLYRIPRFRILAVVLIVLAVLVVPPLIYVELNFHE